MTALPDQLVHRALRAKSGLSGAVFVLAGSAFTPLVGLESADPIADIGTGLLVYAGVLFSVARHPVPARPDVLGVIAIGVAWVLGSVLLLLLAWGQLPITGRCLIAVLALAVEGFATLEFLSLRRPPFPARPAR